MYCSSNVGLVSVPFFFFSFLFLGMELRRITWIRSYFATRKEFQQEQRTLKANVKSVTHYIQLLSRAFITKHSFKVSPAFFPNLLSLEIFQC